MESATAEPMAWKPKCDISELPPRLRRLSEFRKANTKAFDKDDNTVYSFAWDYAEEGHDFWCDVYHGIVPSNLEEVLTAFEKKHPELLEERTEAITLSDFENRAMSTLTAECDNFTYALTGMVAEAGEINDKVAKWRRNGEAFINDDELVFNTYDPDKADEYRRKLALEVFDVMWFCALMARKLHLSLDEVAETGLEKLQRRAKTNTIITHKDH